MAECKVCEAVVALIDAEIGLANVTVAVIGHAVMSLCKVLGGAIVQKECDFVVEHLESIVSWLKEGMNKTQVCERLNLC